MALVPGTIYPATVVGSEGVDLHAAAISSANVGPVTGRAIGRPKPGAPDPLTAESSQAGTWNLANLLTMARLALVPVFGVFLAWDGGNRRSGADWPPPFS